MSSQSARARVPREGEWSCDGAATADVGVPGVSATGAGKTRQERRRLQTRRRIYEAAYELFVANGYDETTIEQIADHADVARATVFNHFQRKSDLVSYWARQRGETLRTLTKQLQQEGGSVRQLILTFLSVLATLTEHERRLSQVMIAAQVRTGLPLSPDWQRFSTEPYTEAVQLGQKQGDIRADIDPEEAAALLRDAYMGTLYRWLDGDVEPPFALKPVLIARADMILDGISTHATDTDVDDEELDG